MKTFVICPVRGEWEHTRQMLHSLDAHEVDDVLIMDHGSEDRTPNEIRAWQRQRRYAEHYPLGGKIHRQGFDPADTTIYDLWNAGFERARRLAQGTEFYVLVTNNDVLLARGSVAFLRRALIGDNWVSYPDYEAAWDSRILTGLLRTRGVLSDGGMSGSCFMLAGHRIPWTPLVNDDGYHWWYGDNHLAEQIELAGGAQVRVEGLPVRHVNEATARHYPHLDALKYADRQRWVTRHERWVDSNERG